MLPPVTVRLGVVADADPGRVWIEFGGGQPVEATVVGEAPGVGSTALCLSTYDRLWCVGQVGKPVDATPVLPPMSDRGDNALVLTADGALMVNGWSRWGSSVVTLDADRRATIGHDRMPDAHNPNHSTYLVQLGDRHLLNPGHVLPMTVGRTPVSFQVEVPGGASGMVIRINWLILAERKSD